jgi:hypothetical protein
MVGGYQGESNPVTDGRTTTLRNLAFTLAERWQDRESLPITQSPLITHAARTMLQPDDISAATPIRQPSNGGDSYFSASHSSEGIWPCNVTGAGGNTQSQAANNEVRDLPQPNQEFDSRLGLGDADETNPGDMTQQILVYKSPAVANQVWSQLTKALAKCNLTDTSDYGVDKQRTGASALVFNGVPGLGSRYSFNSKSSSTSTYDLYLLMGNSVQVVTYTRSVSGDHPVSIDQVAVNQTAESLALRWFGARS